MRPLPNLIANLQYLMHKRGLNSQLKLSKATGVSQTHIGNILRAEQIPSLDILERLADGLGLETWQLLMPTAVLAAGIDREFTSLLESYLDASPGGRRVMLQVAEAQARYNDPADD